MSVHEAAHIPDRQPEPHPHSLAFVLGGWTGPNVLTLFNPDIERPTIAKSAFVHQLAAVTGNMTMGKRVYVAPVAPILGDESNVQDGVALPGFETIDGGKELAKGPVELAGKKYSVYVGKQVSMARRSQVHGPAKIGDDTIIAMQALGPQGRGVDQVVVEPGCEDLRCEDRAGPVRVDGGWSSLSRRTRSQRSRMTTPSRTSTER